LPGNENVITAAGIHCPAKHLIALAYAPDNGNQAVCDARLQKKYTGAKDE
jgi:hypothetical protein